MTISAGSRLGPYEIVSPLGAGGMGEVYRARDTRLERTVAIKVLPQHLSANEEVRQRFEREAKTISQLSHPHICALYDVGSHEGTEYLVMELLEGETLSDRLAKGALPTEQTLRYGIEIADALDKAHRQGIVHRDLKPGNVMLTKSGVKLLDFGLAKAMAQPTQQSGMTSLPTMAGSPNLTQAGTILGTFQYMAPEQLEGKEADVRSDIFAFGAVLYEMATGRKAFEGKSQASLISAIMKEEPAPISAVQPMTPPALDRVVKTCLAKDPEDRFQTAHDVKLQLQWIAEGGSQAGAPAVVLSRRRSRERLAWGISGALLVLAVLLGIGYVRRAPAPALILRSAINLPSKTVLDPFNTALALSPDGQRLAFAASGPDGKRLLWLRSMDGLDVQPLTGTDGATCPFWSPDSRFIGFFADHKLKKVPASGGTVLTICDAPDGRGASWAANDVIVFAPAPFGGLSRVSASGGNQAVLTETKGVGATHRLPHFLPDGKHLLFLSGSSSTDSKDNAIYVLDLDTKKATLFARENSEGRYAEPGYLVFVRDGNLMAQPMDAGRLRITGEAVPIAEKVHFYAPRWSGDFSLSRNGLLVFETGSSGQRRQLTWFDLDGKSLGTVGEPAAFQDFHIAPDGRRAAATIVGAGGGTVSIWMYDLARGVANPFTFGNQTTYSPVWSPDGSQVAYGRIDGSILVKSADGSSEAKAIASDLPNPVATSWSPDAHSVALRIQELKTGGVDIWMAPVDGSRKPYTFLATPASETMGKFSPDGRWLAYVSDESGRSELYVVPFPGPGEKRQISTGGVAGGLAGIAIGVAGGFWLGDGRQVAYLQSDRKLIAVDFNTRGATPEIGSSHPLFGGRPLPEGPFDVARDGKRLLSAVATDESVSSRLTLVTNWAAEIKKK
ncbi:MAG TPA: protein kinase [Thermoanaerobaculia bacterium]|nr:protein kinase [Thermoanaerobaculia bacterium]